MLKLFKKRNHNSCYLFKWPGRIRFALYDLKTCDKMLFLTLEFSSIGRFLSFHLYAIFYCRFLEPALLVKSGSRYFWHGNSEGDYTDTHLSMVLKNESIFEKDWRIYFWRSHLEGSQKCNVQRVKSPFIVRSYLR